MAGESEAENSGPALFDLASYDQAIIQEYFSHTRSDGPHDLFGPFPASACFQGHVDCLNECQHGKAVNVHLMENFEPFWWVMW